MRLERRTRTSARSGWPGSPASRASRSSGASVVKLLQEPTRATSRVAPRSPPRSGTSSWRSGSNGMPCERVVPGLRPVALLARRVRDRARRSPRSPAEPGNRPRFQNNASAPPGRSTRAISGSASGQSNQWNDSPQKTASALASGSGIASAVPASTSASGGRSARMPSSGSTAITRSKCPQQHARQLPGPGAEVDDGRVARQARDRDRIRRPRRPAEVVLLRRPLSNVAAAAGSITGTSRRAGRCSGS